MSGGKYKKYRNPDSVSSVPRSTLYDRRKRDNAALSQQLINQDEQSSSNALPDYEPPIASGPNEPAFLNDNDIEMSDISTLEQENKTCSSPILSENSELSSEPDMDTSVSVHSDVSNKTVGQFDNEIHRESLDQAENNSEEEWSNDIEQLADEENYSLSDDTDSDEDNTFSAQNDRHDAMYADQERDPDLSEKMCPCTSTTKGEALTMAVMLGQKHSLSWIAIIDILRLINKLYQNDVLHATKYWLFKYFPLVDTAIKYHIFCPICGKYVCRQRKIRSAARIECNSCGHNFLEESSSFFITLDLESQFRDLLSNPKVHPHLDYRFRRQKKDEEALEDIYDGKIYKSHTADNGLLKSIYNFSYTFNTDGCQATNSSSMAVWPIYIKIHELPPELRTNYMLLAGLWVHRKEPHMNTLLQPFVEEANLLATKGVKWSLNGDEIISKIIPLCCCVDSVARPCMLNMMRFNGNYGCTFCEHPTEGVEGYRRYTMTSDVPRNRTDRSIKQAMENTSNREIKPIDNNKGVKGASSLMNLEGFDLVDGMVPDYLHSVLLGATRQHTEILLTSPGKEYYVGTPNQLAIINERLTSITPPTCITRQPRSLEERKNWKASEWRLWPIWGSCLCLRDLLPRAYFNHLALLVKAIHIFLQDSITIEMFEEAQELLIKYVVKFQQYFGKAAITYNINLLLHLSDSVRNFGPLMTHNAFGFENENRFILLMKTSPYMVAVQIARRYLFYKHLPSHCEKFPHGNRFIEFCEETFDERLQFVGKVDGCTLIGTGKEYELNDEEAACFGQPMRCKTYYKMILRRLRYTRVVTGNFSPDGPLPPFCRRCLGCPLRYN